MEAVIVEPAVMDPAPPPILPAAGSLAAAQPAVADAELKQIITSAGLSYADCAEPAELRARAAEADARGPMSPREASVHYSAPTGHAFMYAPCEDGTAAPAMTDDQHNAVSEDFKCRICLEVSVTDPTEAPCCGAVFCKEHIETCVPPAYPPMSILPLSSLAPPAHTPSPHTHLTPPSLP